MLRRVRFASVAWWRYLAVLLFLWIPWLHPLSADAQFTHTQITDLTAEFDGYSPSINANGTRIAFISNGDPIGDNPDGNDELFLWIQGAGIIQITKTTKGESWEPSINADGTRIAFRSDRDLIGANADGSDEIFLWVEGSGFTQITNSSVASESPSINADGTKIAFWSRSDPVGTNVDGNEEIFLWTSPSAITQITTTTGGWGSANLAPSINGDGTRIAFWSSVLDTPGPGFEDTGGQ